MVKVKPDLFGGPPAAQRARVGAVTEGRLFGHAAISPVRATDFTCSRHAMNNPLPMMTGAPIQVVAAGSVAKNHHPSAIDQSRLE